MHLSSLRMSFLPAENEKLVIIFFLSATSPYGNTRLAVPPVPQGQLICHVLSSPLLSPGPWCDSPTYYSFPDTPRLNQPRIFLANNSDTIAQKA